MPFLEGFSVDGQALSITIIFVRRRVVSSIEREMHFQYLWITVSQADLRLGHGEQEGVEVPSLLQSKLILRMIRGAALRLWNSKHPK